MPPRPQLKRNSPSFGNYRTAPRALTPASPEGNPVLSFVYDALPARVIFGPGCLDKLKYEIERLGARNALVLSTPEQRNTAALIADKLGESAAGIFDRAAMHVPIGIAEQAREEARRLGADCCVAV